MPSVSNPRHERFAQELVTGVSATGALTEAGNKADRHQAVRRPRAAREKRVPAGPDEAGRAERERAVGAGWGAEMKDALGTSSDAFVSVLLGHLSVAARRAGTDAITEMDMNAALAVVDGVRPENETEAMLAVQMVGTHKLAMEMLARSSVADRRDAINDYGNLAVKLLRTYTAQMEALARVRRKGEQTVRVEHVNVYPGGQAVVGNVHGRGGGGSAGSRQQPQAPDAARPVPPALGSALRSEDEGGR